MTTRLVSTDQLAKLSRTGRRAVIGLSTLAVLAAVTVSAGAALAATAPDTSPPSKPASPVANPVTPINATIRPSGSTDNDRVAGYWVQRQVNGVWTDWSSTYFENSVVYLQQLTPGTTYTIVAVAFDPSGNRSPRSDPVTFTTTSQPAPTCRVMRQILSEQMVFLTPIIENLTVATVSNWTVTFTMPAAHTMNYTFNATLSRSGDAATVTPMPNIANINPGGTAYFGINANRPVGSPLPSGFTLNSPATGSIACTVT